MDIYAFFGLSLRKIILFVLPVLLILFPTYGPFISIDQQFHNSTTVVGPVIAQAFVDRDVEALEEYMCLNIKENVDDLPGEIQKLYDLIDGEITETSFDYHTGGAHMKNTAQKEQYYNIVLKISLQRQTRSIEWKSTMRLLTQSILLRQKSD